jgi:hypothetical protein
VEAALRKGRDLPSWYLDEPPLDPGCVWILAAWGDLNTCRTMGAADLGPIPWTAIVAYADRLGLDWTMGRALAIVVRSMDEAYRAWHREQAERQRDRSKGK